MFLPQILSKQGEDISILLNLDNHSASYICECGEASDLSVKDCQNTAAIFISHSHIDHFINFDTILRHQIGINKNVIICGPKGIIDQVQSKIQAYTWNLIEANAINYEIREIIDDKLIKRCNIRPPKWEKERLADWTANEVYRNDRFSVHFEVLDHKIPSIAYKFTEIDTLKIDLSSSDFKGGKWVKELKKAFEKGENEREITVENNKYKAKDLFYLLKIKKGNTLGIIMDHAANDPNHKKIKTLFNNCDKVLIESFFKIEDKDLAKNTFHSYSKASGEIMKACQVKEAIPVHFSRKYEAAEIIELRKEFELAFKMA